MDDDDSDFTFCPVGIPASKHQLEVLPTKMNDIRIIDGISDVARDSQSATLLWEREPFSGVSLEKKGTADPLPFNESDVQRVLFDKQETVLEKDKSLEKQDSVGSLSFNVVDLSTRKNDLPPPTTSIGSKDSSKDSEEQAAASTRKRVVRAKVPFEKGYSQMDWLRVTRTQHDLAGLKGKSNRRLISMDEVKQHKTGDSIWTVLKGRVYNIAPYMKFHPGGDDMLMKAAGKDCTSLFNKYHAWVNAEFLIEKCLVGVLDETQ
ncbi:hypothetical protein Syun_005997 [Stephania yunnanensis]|uniref:Cytochrome b5 heme-binding domain-containing protein n=1 Tax=Stephania yunnanensis TaxID=152371 RepID=A0AAP0Q0X9_9MAGN